MSTFPFPRDGGEPWVIQANPLLSAVAHMLRVAQDVGKSSQRGPENFR